MIGIGICRCHIGRSGNQLNPPAPPLPPCFVFIRCLLLLARDESLVEGAGSVAEGADTVASEAVRLNVSIDHAFSQMGSIGGRVKPYGP